MKTKTILIVGGIISIGVGYWFMDTDTANAGSGRVMVNSMPTFGNDEVKAEPITKTEAYNKAALKAKEDEEKFRRDTVEKKVSNIAGAMNEVFDDNYTKKVEEFKAQKTQKLVPVYNGKAYPSSNDQASSEPDPFGVKTEATVQRQVSKPVYAASLASNKTAIVKPKSPETPIDSNSQKNSAKKHKGRKVYGSNEITTQEPDLASSMSAQKKSAKGPNDSQISFTAAIFGDQNIKAGSQVKFRTLQEVVIQGISYPRNTNFEGKATFSGDRVLIKVTRLPDATKKNFITVNFDLHDTDLNEGIAATNDNGRDAAIQQGTAGALQTLSTSLSKTSTLANGIAQVARQAQGTPNQKAFLHDGDQVQFIEQLKK